MLAIAVALLCAETTRVNAAGITLTIADMTYLAATNGTWLNDGSIVMMGQFSISDTAISNLVVGGTLSPVNYATLLASFLPLNIQPVKLIGAGTTTGPGDANSGSMLQTYIGTNAAFAGGPIYLMAFNQATTNLNATTQVGVFAGGAYPANMVLGSTTLDLTDTFPLIGTNVTGIAGNSNPYNWGPGNQWNPINQRRLVAVVIPEPSAFMLVGMGLLGAFVLRRTRS
jgi:hypothetical protein